ncbi:MAG: S-methyl-5-thioribose-1-phosphate isomerase [Bacteroidota bacterium]|nr:S-methyl-5-thioribose-1-phosphate isomerase [Bacteroidota bacterium]
MIVNGKSYQSIWINKDDQNSIQIIDQRYLPFELKTCTLKSPEDVIQAISDMQVRGAPLIGVTAAFGIYLAALKEKKSTHIQGKLTEYANQFKASRPTAINLGMAIDYMLDAIKNLQQSEQIVARSFSAASSFLNNEISACKEIGKHGIEIIEKIYSENGGKPVQIMTHCNAGWLATVDHGTATSPIYLAHDRGIPVHVWVDETRPRNQGSRLTAWELGQHAVPHTIITDNTGGHLMQQGMIDLLITGSDRTALNGDTANKIGTYLKALAAYDNQIPFYVALPSSSIDWKLQVGVGHIPVEERDAGEVLSIEGLNTAGEIESVRLSPEYSNAVNYGFDITPARLITGLITEKGICGATKNEILSLFPEMK